MNAPWDIAIIGARFTQLALGTMLAKRGRKVLILDQNQGSPAELQNNLRRRPSPLFGLDGEGLLRRFLDEIGIGQVLVKKAYPANALSYQVVLPRHRINIYPDREATLAEIAREFPASLDPFRTLYQELDSVAGLWSHGHDDLSVIEKRWPAHRGFKDQLKAWWQSRQVPALIQQFQDPDREGGFLALQHHFLGALTPGEQPAALSAAMIHSLGRRGTFQETLGTASLTGLMATRFQEYGGELRRGVRVSVSDDRSHSTLALTTSDGTLINARCLATTADLTQKIEGAPRGRASRGGPREELVPVRFFLGLETRYVPLGMGDDLFLLREDDGGPLGLKMLYLAMSPAGGSSATRDQRSLTVTALVSSAIPPTITEDLKRASEADMLQALEAVIPFLGEGLLSVRSDLVPGEGARLSLPLGGGLLNWSPALMGRSSVRRLRGRFLIMGPTPWELGLEGEALTAMSAAGVAGRVLGKE